MRGPARSAWRFVGLVLLVLLAAACDGTVAGGDTAAEGPPGEAAGSGDPLVMARATWETGHLQAAIYRELLEQLGYDVTDPAEETLDPESFYPRLARGELDLWANGWFPLHARFLDRALVTGQRIAEPIEPVGVQVPDGAVQGFLADRATAEELGITSMADFGRPEVAEAFDHDGDGRADLYGCDEGWGCRSAIDERLAELDWGASVEQISGDYDDLMAQVGERIDAGEPALFYTWTPNWTIDVLEPGDDVVWLESAAPAEVEAPTSVPGLEGCAGEEPCALGWPVNDIRAVANAEFLEANPAVRRLLEAVEIPLADIAAQNARMATDDDYSEEDLAADAEAWLTEHAALVEDWLETARGG